MLKIKFIVQKLKLILAQIAAANHNELFIMIFWKMKQFKWTNALTLETRITGISIQLCLSSHGNELVIKSLLQRIYITVCHYIDR